MSYYAIIGSLSNVRKHSNADRLQVATIYGSQVVVGMEAKDGDVVIYFPVDGKLSEQYCEVNNLIGKKDPETGEKAGGYFDHKRKVRAQKFRGEKSDGFVMPLDSVSFTGYKISNFKIGDQFTNLNSIEICKKYITQATRSQGSGHKNMIKRIKKHYLMFKEHVDTQQLPHYIDKIQKGSLIYISEKVHGTSQRSGYVQVVSDPNALKKKINWITKLNIFKYKKDWQYVTGTRRVILDDFNDPIKQGFYKTNDFRKLWHDKFLNNLRKGETIYYEIVGWVNDATSIMPICDNTKTKDKEFIKLYGDITTFKYGCLQGTSDIYIYRITMTNEDGYSVELPWMAILERCKELGVKPVVDLISPFFYDGDKDKLMKLAEELCEGPSVIDPSHIREGIVFRIENGLNYWALKFKSFNFKILDGIIKDSGVADIEEIESIIEEKSNE